MVTSYKKILTNRLLLIKINEVVAPLEQKNGCAVMKLLSEYYSQQHLQVVQNHGFNQHRVATFIAGTLIMGGELSPVAPQAAEVIDILRDAEDGQFIIWSFAYGAQWDSVDPPMYEQVPNFVPDQYTHKMDEEVET